jgi:hypothetical protein
VAILLDQDDLVIRVHGDHLDPVWVFENIEGRDPNPVSRDAIVRANAHPTISQGVPGCLHYPRSDFGRSSIVFGSLMGALMTRKAARAKDWEFVVPDQFTFRHSRWLNIPALKGA